MDVVTAVESCVEAQAQEMETLNLRQEGEIQAGASQSWWAFWEPARIGTTDLVGGPGQSNPLSDFLCSSTRLVDSSSSQTCKRHSGQVRSLQAHQPNTPFPAIPPPSVAPLGAPSQLL